MNVKATYMCFKCFRLKHMRPVRALYKRTLVQDIKLKGLQIEHRKLLIKKKQAGVGKIGERTTGNFVTFSHLFSSQMKGA